MTDHLKTLPEGTLPPAARVGIIQRNSGGSLVHENVEYASILGLKRKTMLFAMLRITLTHTDPSP